MDLTDIAHRRMRNQRLAGAPFATLDEAVGHLVAIQSQDYAGAKWAVGQRVRGATDAALERALDSGAILRTHVLRPTWHFVTPADIRWLLKLTASRISAAMAYYNRKFELDARTFRRSQALLAKALEGGHHLTREELTQVLERAGIGCKELRPTLLMMQAELDAVITSGPRRGKQFTYALLDERAPPEKTLERDEGLAVLALRYFASHGPAQIRDFAWWSGLTIADAKAGIAMAGAKLVQEKVEGKTYVFAPTAKVSRPNRSTIHLLPNYDEYVVAYKDHDPSFDADVWRAIDPRGNALANHVVVRNGKVIGGWRRLSEKDGVALEARLFVPLAPVERRAMEDAVGRYRRFLGLPVRWSVKRAKLR